MIFFTGNGARSLVTASYKLLHEAQDGSKPNQRQSISTALGFVGSSRGFAEYKKFGPTALMRDGYLELRCKGVGKGEALRSIGKKFGLKDTRTVENKIELLCGALKEKLADVLRVHGIVDRP